MDPTHQKSELTVTTQLDVCVVTKNPLGRIESVLSRNLKRLPCHHLIVERSKPLGLARQIAIEKVDTPWFVFLDDDIELGPSWWNDMVHAAKPDAGALTGSVSVKGLGIFWDSEINNWLRKRLRAPSEIRERAYTHNTIIRKDIVSDWKPSNRFLEAYEDYELTQHVRSKGYKWLEVPTVAYHLKTWRDTAANSLWTAKTKRYSTARRSPVRNIFTSCAWMVRVLLDMHYPLPVKVVVWWQHGFMILGYLTSARV